jgi:hypothetical protein
LRGGLWKEFFVPKRTPAGYWYPVIDYIEFNDGSRALRFWYEKYERFKIFRGMLIKEYDIKELKKEIDKTFAIKTLLRKFIE